MFHQKFLFISDEKYVSMSQWGSKWILMQVVIDSWLSVLVVPGEQNSLYLLCSKMTLTGCIRSYGGMI